MVQIGDHDHQGSHPIRTDGRSGGALVVKFLPLNSKEPPEAQLQ